MAAKPLPSQEVLRQLLRYEPETGKLFWKERGPEWFIDGARSARALAKGWNAKNAGKEAFTATNAGYGYGALFNTLYLAHRIIWKMTFGSEPNQIDHIDGDRKNNRISNLRDVTETQNKRNMCIPSHNTSGVIGVSFDAPRNKWAAHVTLADRKKHIGYFSDFDDAVVARRAAEIEYGFHQNHGRTISKENRT